MALFQVHMLSSSPLSPHPLSTSLSRALIIQSRRRGSQTPFNSHKLETNNEHIHQTSSSNVQTNSKKTKTQGRPSFFDEARERWSARIPSNRSNLPWQQQQQKQQEQQHSNPQSEDYACFSDDDDDDDSDKVSISRSHNRLELGVGDEIKAHVSGQMKERGGSGGEQDDGVEIHVLGELSEGTGDKTERFLNFLPANRTNSAPWAHGGMGAQSHLDSGKKVQFLGLMKERGGFDGEESKEGKIRGLGRTTEEKAAKFERVSIFPPANSPNLAPWTHRGMGGQSNFDSDQIVRSEDIAVGDELEQLKGVGETLNCPSKEIEESFTSSIICKLKEFGDESESIFSVGKWSYFNLNASHFPKQMNGEGQVGDSCTGAVRDLLGDGGLVPVPWERENWRKSNTELAEKTIPEPELRRLRNVALRMKERMKVGSAGITLAVVDKIHEKWKAVEVVKIKFEGPPTLNMKRTHDVLESKTGGLVIWRSGSSIVLYRGMTYELPCVQHYVKQSQLDEDSNSHSKDLIFRGGATNESNVGSELAFEDPYGQFTNISEVNEMLDELGPRYLDWSGCEPLPVDADLLPGVVPGYKPPFRILPYGMRHSLQNKQMTTLRRLARTVPPHFALGRNRQQQGLAKAILKLWEKSSIAKIAIKRGVLNTCNERMAEEIKKLTGGVLISRNKDYIVFYRGNDFLSPLMKDPLLHRQELGKIQQDEEELARIKASNSLVLYVRTARGPLVAGTLAETIEAQSQWAQQPSYEDRERMKRDAAFAKHASFVKYLERKLANAIWKVKKAERALRKVQASLEPAELPNDQETLTDEERFLFRKMGLSMKPFLLLGRRGVFDGTVENMHLHWKYKELVKLIVKGKSFPQAKQIAISLEAESGGILVSLDKTSKGYAIIVYRGKNYKRPQSLRPKNLLTRRQALSRSIELQRREALNHHISSLRERIEMLKSELKQMEAAKETNDEDVYLRLHDAYSSDEYLDVEGEEAYFDAYDSGIDSDNAAIDSLHSESSPGVTG